MFELKNKSVMLKTGYSLYAFSINIVRSYSTSGPVSMWMGDRLWAITSHIGQLSFMKCYIYVYATRLHVSKCLFSMLQYSEFTVP